jgi:hypothetical protein
MNLFQLTRLIDVAFLISNYLKDERLGGKGGNDIFAALGGSKPV